MNKKNRTEIANENEKLVKTHVFEKIPVSKKYNLSTIMNPHELSTMSRIICFNGYTDDAIKYFSQFNKKTCALNFANAYHAGGGYLRGAIAQEEELCRQYPTLYTALVKSKYPLKFGEMIYTYDVPRYRENIKMDYEIINNPVIFCDFISCASPNLNQRRFEEITENEYKHINVSMDLMFKVAINNNVKVLILGAWGCGAFAPLDNTAPNYSYTTFIANEFKKTAEKYVNSFDIIAFAVPNDFNGKVFVNVLKKLNI